MISADRLADVRRYLNRSISFDHLTRYDWRRQTDCVQQAFIVARLFADCGSAAIFVDGHIGDRIKTNAIAHPAGVKAFFNRRFHDAGYKARRVVVFDTLTTRKMGKRGSGLHKLHFHAVLELPLGTTKADMQRLLEKVFGKAAPMGQRQFHFTSYKWEQYYTHNGVQISGPLGKMAYAMAHAGTTYHNLDLNEGKRSRSAPTSRGACNRNAYGLARGIPSNFNAEIVFCDNASKRAGKEAFEMWVKAERDRLRPQRTNETASLSVDPGSASPMGTTRRIA